MIGATPDCTVDVYYRRAIGEGIRGPGRIRGAASAFLSVDGYRTLTRYGGADTLRG